MMNAILLLAGALALCAAAAGRAESAALCGLLDCGANSDGYAALNKLLTKKLRADDQLSEAGQFARQFLRSESAELKAAEAELAGLLAVLARIDLEQFGPCDSENLHGLMELSAARAAANRKKMEQATRLNGLIDAYFAEAKVKCYEQVASKWAPSDEVFEGLFGEDIKRLDLLLTHFRGMHTKGSKYDEARKLDTAVAASRWDRPDERLFDPEHIEQIVTDLYQREHGEEAFYWDEPLEDTTRFIKRRIQDKCAEFMERPESVRVLRPLVDLTAASAATRGLGDVSLDGWFQGGRDGNHSFMWAARYALCERLVRMDAQQMAKSIR